MQADEAKDYVKKRRAELLQQGLTNTYEIINIILRELYHNFRFLVWDKQCPQLIVHSVDPDGVIYHMHS